MTDSKIETYVVDTENIPKKAIELIKKLTNYQGVVVSLAKPAELTLNELKKSKVNTRDILFIDAKEKGSSDQIISISSTSALTELSIAISQLLQAFPNKKRYFLIEGVNILTIHNKTEVVQRFIQFIISKLRLWGVDGYFILS